MARLHGPARPEWRMRPQAIRGPTENCETAIAFAAGSDHLTAVLAHQAFDQRIVADQGGAHCVGVPYPGAGAALDVGE